MAKPRTNYDTINYWADSIHAREPAKAIQVNSIIVERDVIYSFGHHFPMGVIERYANGRAKRVVINSDYYPKRGFADTPGDHSNVRACARAQCSGTNVPLVNVLLSSYRDGSVQLRPKPDDPEPPAHVDYEVPVFFWASDPGPEPVDQHPEECVAGERYGTSTWNDHIMKWSNDLRDEYDPDGPDAFFSEMHRYSRVDYEPVGRANHVLAWIDAIERGRELLWVDAWVTTYTEYGIEEWNSVEGATYKQCPHCSAFAQVHRAWHDKMYGSYGRNHRRGWSQFCELVERYAHSAIKSNTQLSFEGEYNPRDFVDGWREARKTDAKRVTAERRARKGWEERNLIDLGRVPNKSYACPIPDLGPDGFVKRKHELAFKREDRKRAAEAAERVWRERIYNFVRSNEPQVYSVKDKPLAVVLPRTSEAFVPSLVLVKKTTPLRDKEEILLHASERGNRIQIVPTKVVTEAASYVKTN